MNLTILPFLCSLSWYLWIFVVVFMLLNVNGEFHLSSLLYITSFQLLVYCTFASIHCKLILSSASDVNANKSTGWHTYFWISFIPLLVSVLTK